MRAHLLTQREMTTGQRQMRVSDLVAQHHGPEAIAEQLGLDVELVRKDLADMEVEGYYEDYEPPSVRRGQCATESGFQAHKYRGEEACADCALAHSRNQRARSIRAGRQHSIRVGAAALGALYLNAPEAQRQHLADELGLDVCEALVDYHHQIERATGR
ncbi:hypothetical protein BJD60_gp60 [Gordonia phage Schnabeltier]|uniref:Helix-turn-helix DNA binding domain protein n=1 Tax=Gordonia phage Schnabeltier TaxID=1821561 RepID=A0A142KA48_9CAUD|nr:hypothetical protein BJD60_gp60 [Gordonia phage Schnabeltier]AMS02981.1 hypothetical protein SEA_SCHNABELTIER_60 [Gordonia phage Schnabeltier]